MDGIINGKNISVNFDNNKYDFDFSFEYRECNYMVLKTNNKEIVVIVLRNEMFNAYPYDLLPSDVKEKVDYYNEFFEKLNLGDE